MSGVNQILAFSGPHKKKQNRNKVAQMFPQGVVTPIGAVDTAATGVKKL